MQQQPQEGGPNPVDVIPKDTLARIEQGPRAEKERSDIHRQIIDETARRIREESEVEQSHEPQAEPGAAQTETPTNAQAPSEEGTAGAAHDCQPDRPAVVPLQTQTPYPEAQVPCSAQLDCGTSGSFGCQSHYETGQAQAAPCLPIQPERSHDQQTSVEARCEEQTCEHPSSGCGDEAHFTSEEARLSDCQGEPQCPPTESQARLSESVPSSTAYEEEPSCTSCQQEERTACASSALPYEAKCQDCREAEECQGTGEFAPQFSEAAVCMTERAETTLSSSCHPEEPGCATSGKGQSAHAANCAEQQTACSECEAREEGCAPQCPVVQPQPKEGAQVEAQCFAADCSAFVETQPVECQSQRAAGTSCQAGEAQPPEFEQRCAPATESTPAYAESGQCADQCSQTYHVICEASQPIECPPQSAEPAPCTGRETRSGESMPSAEFAQQFGEELQYAESTSDPGCSSGEQEPALSSQEAWCEASAEREAQRSDKSVVTDCQGTGEAPCDAQCRPVSEPTPQCEQGPCPVCDQSDSERGVDQSSPPAECAGRTIRPDCQPAQTARQQKCSAGGDCASRCEQATAECESCGDCGQDRQSTPQQENQETSQCQSECRCPSKECTATQCQDCSEGPSRPSSAGQQSEASCAPTCEEPSSP